MKTILMLVSLTIASTVYGQVDRNLRAFVVPIEADDIAAVSAGEGYIYGNLFFVLNQLRNGDEFGHQVSAVWISKKDWKWKTCILTEESPLGVHVNRVELKNGKIEIEFSWRQGKSKTVSLTPIPNNDLGVVFIKDVGIETPLGTTK